MQVFVANRLLRLEDLARKNFHLAVACLVQKAVKRAVAEAGVTEAASCHTFRHAIVTHLMERGQNIRTIQELLGHQDVSTTMIDT